MVEYEIICIVHDKEERITHVGLVSDGVGIPIESIILLMNAGHIFYTNVNNQKVQVIHRTHPVSKKEFLTTEPDGTNENNLDFLPLCESLPPLSKFSLTHVYVATTDVYKIESQGTMKRVLFSLQGRLPIHHPGSLKIRAVGSYSISKIVNHKMQTATAAFRPPITVTINSPDVRESNARRESILPLIT